MQTLSVEEKQAITQKSSLVGTKVGTGTKGANSSGAGAAGGKGNGKGRR